METQEKMYEIFYNNQSYAEFITTKHFKKAVTNEQTLKTMLKNNIYAKYLRSINKSLDRKEIISELDKFEDKFWLKKEPLNLVLFLKHCKNNDTKPEYVYYFFTQKKLADSLYTYLSTLLTKTKVKEKIIAEIANLTDIDFVESLKDIIKHKLI
jgi:hypothetical protein